MAWVAVVGAVLAATTPPSVPPPAPPSVPAVESTVPATSIPVTGASDPVGCEALVFDPSGELDVDAVTSAATEAAATLGADLHVRAERNLDGGLDARMTQLQAQCPTWWSGTDRAPDLVVVMYSSTEREASVFYGPGQSFQLEFRWEHAVDEMGPEFAAGDYTAGVVAGLAALQQDPPVAYQPSYAPTQYDDDDEGSGSGSGSTGVPPAIWLCLGLLVIVALVRVAQFATTGEWSADDDGGSTWSSSRRSGWGSSSRSSSRRSFSSSRSSRSSRSSSTRRSSGRSGGGTKKW